MAVAEADGLGARSGIVIPGLEIQSDGRSGISGSEH